MLFRGLVRCVFFGFVVEFVVYRRLFLVVVLSCDCCHVLGNLGELGGYLGFSWLCSVSIGFCLGVFSSAGFRMSLKDWTSRVAYLVGSTWFEVVGRAVVDFLGVVGMTRYGSCSSGVCVSRGSGEGFVSRVVRGVRLLVDRERSVEC